MAFIVTSVNKLKSGFVALCALLLWGLSGACLTEEPYLVGPVHSAADLRLLSADVWHPGDADQAETLIKHSYLRGLLDALQYVQVAPKSASQVLQSLQSQDLGQLVSAMDQYYLADPNRREPPAAVLLRILPLAATKSPPPAAPPAGPEAPSAAPPTPAR